MLQSLNSDATHPASPFVVFHRFRSNNSMILPTPISVPPKCLTHFINWI